MHWKSGERQMLSRLDHLLSYINKSLMLLAAAGLVMLGGIIVADVTGRALFSSPIIGISEAAAHLLVIVAFLQLPHSVRIGGMLRVEVMEMLAPKGIARFFRLAGHLIGALFLVLIAYYTWDRMVIAWVTGQFAGHPGFPVPVFPTRLIVFVGSILGAANFIMLAVLTLLPQHKMTADLPPQEVAEHG
jgi:TRAP-type C4-dicarboxylate transport system permease small subunit